MGNSILTELEGSTFAETVAIDPDRLEEECAAQPPLHWRYSKMHAQAKRESTRAAEKLKVVRAELILEIKKNPERYGLDKPTESAVESTYLTQPNYQAAVNELVEAQYAESLLQSAVFSFNHRKDMLSEEVRLFVANWFSGPSSPRKLDPGKRLPTFPDPIDKGRIEYNERRRQRRSPEPNMTKEE